MGAVPVTPGSATLGSTRARALSFIDPSATTSPKRDADDWSDAHRAIVELLALGPDWDGYGAKTIDRVAVQVADRYLDHFRRMGLPQPSVFPVPDGGVQIEWMRGPVELEFEIHPGGAPVVFVCDDPRIPGGMDGELPADSDRLALALDRLRAYS